MHNQLPKQVDNECMTYGHISLLMNMLKEIHNLNNVNRLYKSYETMYDWHYTTVYHFKIL